MNSGKLPNKISIEGHTDSKPYSGKRNYGNWELSTDRANSARRLMQQDGLGPQQVAQVRGFADQLLRKPKTRLILLTAVSLSLCSTATRKTLRKERQPQLSRRQRPRKKQQNEPSAERNHSEPVPARLQLSLHLEGTLNPTRGIGRDPNVICSGRHNPVHRRIVRAEVVCFDAELHSLAFSRTERNSLKSLKLADRPRCRRHAVMDVKLHDFGALALPVFSISAPSRGQRPFLRNRWRFYCQF